MKNAPLFIYVFVICIFSVFITAKSDNAFQTVQTVEASIDSAVFSINQLFDYFTNNGILIDYSVNNDAGMRWPQEYRFSICFQSGIWLIGKDTDSDFRSACPYYSTVLLPGKILPDGTPDDPNQSKYKIYTINRGNTDSFDYLNWPADDGAPVDENGNPLLLGDRTHWFVCNDADPAPHEYVFNTEPIGVECQYTLFGVDSVQGLENVMFVRGLFINKSNDTLDSAYFGLWSDPDVGSAVDDQVGFDTTLALAYCYNGDNLDVNRWGPYFGTKPPTFGTLLLQGPIVASPGDSAHFMGNLRPNTKNIGINSFFSNSCGSLDCPEPENASEAYSYMQGKKIDGTQMINPQTGEPTSIAFPGDPVAGTGWIDDFSPSDRRFLASAGPFTFAPGDSQEIVFAYIVGRGVDRLSSISSLRKTAEYCRLVYENNFRNMVLPVNLYHRPEKLKESYSGTDFTVNIKTADNVSLDQTACSFYYALDSAATFQQLPLSQSSVNPDDYYATLPDDDNEHLIRYYFAVQTTEGETFSLPVAAPDVYFENYIGPDKTAPELAAESQTFQSIFFNSSRKVDGTIEYRDRLPVGAVQLQSKRNNEDWTNEQAVTFTVSPQPRFDSYDYIAEINWSGVVNWNSANYGDIISYRIAVTDSSAAENITAIETGQITIKKLEDIGDFTAVSTTNPATYPKNWIADGWYYKSLSPEAWSVFVLPDSIANYSDNLNATYQFQKKIPVSDYDSLFLRLYQYCSIAAGDTAFIEISPDAQTWYALNKFSNIQYTDQQWATFSLSGQSYCDSCYLRLRFQTDDISEDYIYGWAINRIRLIADSAAVGIVSPENLVYRYRLSPNYPNPFNPGTTISFELQEEVFTTIRIYNLKGQLVQTLVNQKLPAGRHQRIWNADNLPSGIYFYQINAGSFQQTRKCILLK